MKHTNWIMVTRLKFTRLYVSIIENVSKQNVKKSLRQDFSLNKQILLTYFKSCLSNSLYKKQNRHSGALLTKSMKYK